LRAVPVTGPDTCTSASPIRRSPEGHMLTRSPLVTVRAPA
jgi:hypothetical protein